MFVLRVCCIVGGCWKTSETRGDNTAQEQGKRKLKMLCELSLVLFDCMVHWLGQSGAESANTVLAFLDRRLKKR